MLSCLPTMLLCPASHVHPSFCAGGQDTISILTLNHLSPTCWLHFNDMDLQSIMIVVQSGNVSELQSLPTSPC